MTSTGTSPVELYFPGSLILAKPCDLPDSDVVDGQQRLTTLALLPAALRATTTGSAADNLGKLLYEEGDEMFGRREHCRLTLRPNDHPYFRRLILSDPDLNQLRSPSCSRRTQRAM